MQVKGKIMIELFPFLFLTRSRDGAQFTTVFIGDAKEHIYQSGVDVF